MTAKQFLIATRYYLSLPWRRRMMRVLCKQGMAPMMILFYHRVADASPNAWTISNSSFRKQIDWIQSRFEMISLADAQERMRIGRNNRPTVTITFDDGYSENCESALPLLIHRGIPVTYFVTLDNVLFEKPFPHDESGGTPLPPNTLEQIITLANAGIEIGAHAKTHSDIGKIRDDAVLRNEIFHPKREWEKLIQRPVRFFAFPFGKHDNMHSQAVNLIREAGYDGFCSAYGNYNQPHNDPFHLQRIHGDPEMIRLKNWLSYDTRKRRVVTVPQFQSNESVDNTTSQQNELDSHELVRN